MRRWNFSTVLNLGEEIKRKLRITVTQTLFPTKICSRESNVLLEASKPYPHLVCMDRFSDVLSRICLQTLFSTKSRLIKYIDDIIDDDKITKRSQSQI